MRIKSICLLILTIFLQSCGETSDAGFAESSARGELYPDQVSGSTGVSQPGAQDFGRFRSIIESGQLPAVETFDSVGFFSEHKFDLPEANCGNSICLHAQLGVGGNLMNGNNCTLVLLGLNSPINIDEESRLPLDLAIAIDLSGSMQGAPLENVKRGLGLLANELQPLDRVTLVGYSSDAEVLFVSDMESDPDREGLRGAIETLQASGSTNIYDGLRLAYQSVSAPYPALNFANPTREEVAGETPAGEEVAGEAPAGEDVAGETPAGEEIAGEAPAGEEVAGEAPAGEEVAGEAPAGEEVAGEAPAGEEVAGETPAGEEVAGEAPAGEEVAGEVMVGPIDETQRQKRVLLLSDGLITSGISESGRFYALVREYAARGVNLGTIGLGVDFDLPLMQTLAELGSGTFYFIDDFSAVYEVFAEEVKSFLVPIARELSISLEASEGYSFRAAYATRLWRSEGERGSIYLPAAYLAGRLNSNDTGMSGGRRGGGGGIILEFTPDRDAEVSGSDHEVARINLQYQGPELAESGAAEQFEQSVVVQNPLEFGEIGEGSYASPSVEKAFVVLNLYAGIKIGLERANLGARGAALNMLVPLYDRVEAWHSERESPDVDIADDLDILAKLIEIISGGQDLTRFRESQRTEISPWPVD